MPTGYDDEGLRIVKYEVELRLLRTFVTRTWVTDLDNLSASFTGLACNSEYRVRVRAWNMFTNANSAAGAWAYSPFRKTRGCPLPAAPSDVTVTGVNKAGLEITWTAPPETENWGNNVGYYAIRFRPAYQVSGGQPLEWATAKAGTDEVKKTLWVERHPSLECGLTYTVEIRTVGSKHNKGPWQSLTGSTPPC
mmetsp:Transcript_22927/g.29898  ORF Transcript_22927/g.29898 Transcript_22927/m.29898 type:complete len:193 (-) Transcript_22927:167-745(-)